tara:strand:+ start:320 stop:2407 length:2088 start_codon:yes stop_codon:yes gene_type:complete
LSPIKAENKYHQSYLGENRILKIKNLKDLYLDDLELNSIISFNLKKQLKEDIIRYENKFINLLTLEKISNTKLKNSKSFDIDIESDIQYEKNGIYYAEGDVIVSFSNFLIKGDKLIYDKINKAININGNVIFLKGNQYFEATKVFYNLKLNEGYIDNIYGIIDSKTLINDFEFKDVNKISNVYEFKKADNLRYENDADLVKIDNFYEQERFQVSEFDFDIFSITKWRYKSDQLILQNDVIKSKKILLTNDPINKPQFIFESKNFTGEIEDQKIKIVSKNNRIILDNKFIFPIGKRTIFDEEEKSSWRLGSDFKEKDGFYLSRNFKNIKINDYFKFKYEPYLLFQRSLKGSTKSFTMRDESILSEKVKDNIDLSDLFALDTELEGNFDSLNLNWQTKLNSFNPQRLSQSFRTKLYLTKSYDLNTKNNINIKKIDKNNDEENFENFIDFKISSAFREKISRGYSGENEIYFGNSFNIKNRKSWSKNDNSNYLNLIYDVGKFKAETKEGKSFNNLYRNVFAIQLGNKYPLLKLIPEDKNIDSRYRFSPSIIYPGLNWITNIQSGIFLYSNGESQEAISISSGPEINLGLFKKDFLDYTFINLRGIYVLKNGDSPFKFDDINKDFTINLELKQQLIGPLVFSYGNSYNVEEEKFNLPKYGLEISRRAYSIGLYYDSLNQSGGFKFNIFNFDYSKITPKF